MRQDIEFDAEGVTLRGWLYLPDEATGPVPTVVMAHGFSAVKEMYLDSFAEAFAAGGLGALVFDNRNFGASDGEPRQEIDPWAQVRDYRHTITWAQARSEVDADRIGVWGSATAVAMCWSWARSTSASSVSPVRRRWLAAFATSGGWSARTS